MKDMITPRIFPLVLCGGMGSRLWPMSRVDQPKQFQPTAGQGSASYFQATLLRHRGPGFQAPIVVTGFRHGAIVDRQMNELQLSGTVIAEPLGRNTGPAVLAAALNVLQDDGDALLLVLPSDHIIRGDVNTIIQRMAAPAEDGRIITFGVVPRYAETGYGYITDAGASGTHDGLHNVDRFIEKPPVELAQALIDGGLSYWASGISLFRADVIVEEYRRQDPATVDCVAAALALGLRRPTSGGRRAHVQLEEVSFRQARNLPTERAVFEVTDRIGLAPLHGIDWDDVGAWSAVHRTSVADDQRNVLTGDVITLDTRNSLVQADGRLVAVIGMDDVVVVDTPDALLVAHRERSQEVKKLVETLQAANRAEAKSHVARDTSWGQVEVLSRTQGYDMRLITVNPGEALAIHGIEGGSSLVTVVSGRVDCAPDGEAFRTIQTGQSVEIGPQARLQVSNPLGDSVKLIQILFSAGPEEPACAEPGPANDGVSVTVPADAVQVAESLSHRHRRLAAIRAAVLPDVGLFAANA
jgi:mannose-1-phosphate guanylyltransferase / mannose-6-phosphate isomerase